MLVMTDAGRLQSASTGQQSEPTQHQPRLEAIGGPSSAAAERRAAQVDGWEAIPAAPRADSKQALLVDLLRRKEGATIAEVVKATGWQPHSVRGAISGSLKKKLGLAVVSDKMEGRGRVYRITRKR
jgi:hypothetical protein